MAKIPSTLHPLSPKGRFSNNSRYQQTAKPPRQSQGISHMSKRSLAKRENIKK